MSEEILSEQNFCDGQPKQPAEIDPIRGKVARVISNRTVALNIGENHDVQEGMLFDILVPGTLEIADPETGEVLGIVRPGTKARIRVLSVREKFSLAATYRTESIGGIRLRGDLAFGRRTEEFKTRDTLHEGFADQASYVTAGDPVVQVIEGT